MGKIIEVLIHKSPFLIMLSKLTSIIFQKIGFEFSLIEEIITFVYDSFITSATDCFSLLIHCGVEVTFALVLGIGIYINV